MIRLEVWGFRCLRCGHVWLPKIPLTLVEESSGPPKIDEPPRLCPRCKTAWWDTPREGAAESPKSKADSPAKPKRSARKTNTRIKNVA